MTWFHVVLQRLQQLIKCDKLSGSTRLNTTREWNNRNVWNDPALTVQDQLAKELSNKNITEHNIGS